MIALDFRETARTLGCEVPGEGAFTGLTTDSRAVEPGMLFAALPGARADGHDFVAQAAAAGAAAVLVSRPVECDLPQFRVDDVLLSLGRLALAWRDRVNPRIVAITGSNGKTTTKEMLAGILSLEGPVLATSGNYNNELGVPLTLFRLAPEHRYAVIEMGAGKAGDIAYLAGIARPDVGLITNVGPAHLKGFGDEEGVARAKGEMYAALPADGLAVLNHDEPWLALWRELCATERVLTFGLSADADVRCLEPGDCATVETPAGSFPLRLSLPGVHNVRNALAATAAAVALDVPLASIEAGLAAARPVPGRLNTVDTANGWTVIDDTYNANPASLYAALQVLNSRPGERWLVLGDMRELGQNTRKMHAEMGEAAAALGVSRLYCVGELTPAAAEAFGQGALHFADREALIERLCRDLHAGVTCLVKGSRSMAMEQVVAAVTGDCRMQEAG